MEPVSEFVQQINKSLSVMWSIDKNVQIILEKIPSLRNAGEKKFARAYKRLVYGFGPRKDSLYTNQKWVQMPHDDPINRSKRRVVTKHSELGKNEHKAIVYAGLTQAGIMEYVTQEEKPNQDLWA